MSSCGVTCLLVIVLISSVVGYGTNQIGGDVIYQERINTCFQQLFQSNLTCSQWAENNFEEFGAWYHPNLPDGAVGWTQISDFCSDTRVDYSQSSYLPTVLPSLTHSGEYSYASVDYVFASNQSNSPFANWGNVFFALSKSSNQTSNGILIHFAVETWERRVWQDQLQ